jgi:hypothetical protein
VNLDERRKKQRRKSLKLFWKRCEIGEERVEEIKSEKSEKEFEKSYL